MAMRKDAGMALIDLAAWVAHEFPKHARPDTVWNIGCIAFQPGAANVVPSQGELVLEFGDAEADVLDLLEKFGFVPYPRDEGRRGFHGN